MVSDEPRYFCITRYEYGTSCVSKHSKHDLSLRFSGLHCNFIILLYYRMMEDHHSKLKIKFNKCLAGRFNINTVRLHYIYGFT